MHEYINNCSDIFNNSQRSEIHIIYYYIQLQPSLPND